MVLGTMVNQKRLVIVAHPSLGSSRLNHRLAEAVRVSGVATVHVLEPANLERPSGIREEQLRVEEHDRIIFQFPLHWYSCPTLLSEWMARVFLRGWAYGPGGRALNFKTFGVAVTTGSNGRDYAHQGRYRRTLEEVLVPFELLARHTGMHYLPPFAITGAREVLDDELDLRALAYCHHVSSAAPVFEFDGSDDGRAQTVYPAHYYLPESSGSSHA